MAMLVCIDGVPAVITNSDNSDFKSTFNQEISLEENSSIKGIRKYVVSKD
jgi:hypothetical protein